MRDSKLPFLINDKISFTKLTSLLLCYNIDAYVCNVWSYGGSNYFRTFDGGSVRIKGVKTLYFSGAGTFPQFSAGHQNLSCYRSPCNLPAAREAIHVSTGSYVTFGQHLVSLLWKHSCAFLLMVLFLRSIITD